jgi:hypothetical protein
MLAKTIGPPENRKFVSSDRFVKVRKASLKDDVSRPHKTQEVDCSPSPGIG